MTKPEPANAVKGLAVRAGLRWVATEYGDSAVDEIYALASPTLKRIIAPGLASFGILSTNWYDASSIAELLNLVVTASRASDELALFQKMAEAIAGDNVHGAHKALFRLIATRPMLVAHGHRVWSNYFTEGTLAIQSAREGEIQFSVLGTKTHHDSLCLITSRVLECILVEVGYKGATLTRTECRGKGSAHCSFEVDYVG